jgi:hypothetical protein
MGAANACELSRRKTAPDALAAKTPKASRVNLRFMVTPGREAEQNANSLVRELGT